MCEGVYQDGTNPGTILDCPNEDEPILVPDLTFGGRIECTNNPQQCPGSYHFGCDGGDNPGSLTCDVYSNNLLGDCDGCEGQIFVSEDCTESFYCTSDTPDSSSEGCHLQCPEGQRVHVDLIKDEWECVERDPNPQFICPGYFAVSRGYS